MTYEEMNDVIENAIALIESRGGDKRILADLLDDLAQGIYNDQAKEDDV